VNSDPHFASTFREFPNVRMSNVSHDLNGLNGAQRLNGWNSLMPMAVAGFTQRFVECPILFRCCGNRNASESGGFGLPSIHLFKP
jgi:hypothetical protein